VLLVLQVRMKKAFFLILLFNIFRVAIIPLFALLPIELEYFQNSHSTFQLQNQLPYLIPWLVSRSITFQINQIVVFRFVHFIITLLTQWSLYLLISKVIRSSKNLTSWLVIASTLSITFISTVTISDTILALAWVLCLLFLYEGIFNNKIWGWILGGIFMGIAILTKLSGIALPVGLFLFLIFSLRYRRLLATYMPYATLVIALLIDIPIFFGVLPAQNIQLPIVQFDIFLTQMGMNTNPFNVFLMCQLTLIFPVLYIGLWWVTFKYFGRFFEKPNQVNPELWFMLSFFLPLFIGFHLIAIFSWVDILGMIPVYISGMIVLLKLIKKRWLYWAIGFSVFAHLALLVYLLY